MTQKTILVTGGGTGGHLMPALAICEILSDEGYKPILVTDSRCLPYLPKNNKFDTKIIDVTRPNSFINFFLFFRTLISSIFTVIKIILDNKVKLTIACGGYSSLPVLISSIFTWTNLILHEQNSYLGRVNYWFSYLSDKLFTSFMHTINLPLRDSSKIIWTGIPVTKKHIQALSNQDKIYKENEKTLLITGGSQGAEYFDNAIFDAMKILTDKHKNVKFKIIQQSRNAENSELHQKYKEIGVKSKIQNFFHDLEKQYPKCDLFIGRAGASTISELIHYTLPSILIPYPYAKDDHQYQNAMNLAGFGASRLMRQSDITPEKLSNEIEEILFNKSITDKISHLLQELKINSNKIIISEIKKIIDK